MTADLRRRFGPEYDAAFSRYVARPAEAGLAVAYEIGRSAVVRGLNLLDLSAMHHAALLRELRHADGPEDVEARTLAASSFFGEVLATFEMTRRGFVEGLPAAGEEPSGRRRA
jgi:two-component system, NarL family, sensor histidine kinase UhpB